MGITGVRTFPSPDAFDPYGVLEGLMAGTEIKREWMVSLPDHSDLDNIQDIEFKSDGSIVASFYSGPLSTGNKTTTYHIAAE